IKCSKKKEGPVEQSSGSDAYEDGEKSSELGTAVSQYTTGTLESKKPIDSVDVSHSAPTMSSASSVPKTAIAGSTLSVASTANSATLTAAPTESSDATSQDGLYWTLSAMQSEDGVE
ncbi:hypothetical protein OSTOST_07192, partial [Ostertagia ostertagi]